MSKACNAADAIRDQYADKNFEDTISLVELEDNEMCSHGLNLRKYSHDGHSWNNKPYICYKSKW